MRYLTSLYWWIYILWNCCGSRSSSIEDISAIISKATKWGRIDSTKRSWEGHKSLPQVFSLHQVYTYEIQYVLSIVHINTNLLIDKGYWNLSTAYRLQILLPVSGFLSLISCGLQCSGVSQERLVFGTGQSGNEWTGLPHSCLCIVKPWRESKEKPIGQLRIKLLQKKGKGNGCDWEN